MDYVFFNSAPDVGTMFINSAPDISTMFINSAPDVGTMFINSALDVGTMFIHSALGPDVSTLFIHSSALPTLAQETWRHVTAGAEAREISHASPRLSTLDNLSTAWKLSLPGIASGITTPVFRVVMGPYLCLLSSA